LVFCGLYHAGADFTLPDSGSYLGPANVLLSKGMFWSNPGIWMRTPLYPLIISGIYWLVGKNLFYVIFFQIFMSGLLVINAYRITELLSNSKMGLFAAGLVAVDYLFISYSNLIMTDLLFAVIFSFIFYYIIKFTQRKSDYLSLAVIGILLAIATLMRPVSYYLTPILAIALFIYTFKKDSFIKALKYFLILAVPSLLLVGGWQIRNKAVIGTYQYTNIDAVNLYHYYAADNIAHIRGISVAQAQEWLKSQASALGFKNKVDKYNYYRSEGLRILLHNPQWSAVQFVSGFVRTMFGNDYILLFYNQSLFVHGKNLERMLLRHNASQIINGFSFADGLKLVTMVLFFAFNMLLVLASGYFIFYLICYGSEYKKMVWPLLIILIYFILVSSNYCSLARFRLPYELLLDSFAPLGYLRFRLNRQVKRFGKSFVF
jgi:4-amino-4-deoxy-L-arabinose transferase-like glycosyltransferase